mgnify:FL=1
MAASQYHGRIKSLIPWSHPLIAMTVPIFRVALGLGSARLALSRLPSLRSGLTHLLIYGWASCLVVGLWTSTATVAWADVSPPAELFEVHCAGCHPNGANIIRRGKNLKQKALKRYGYDSTDEIATLITNGKGLMSAYGERLSEDDITNLANYVLEQAATDWQTAK